MGKIQKMLIGLILKSKKDEKLWVLYDFAIRLKI